MLMKHARLAGVLDTTPHANMVTHLLIYSFTHLFAYSFTYLLTAKEDMVMLLLEYAPSLMYAVDQDGNIGFHEACKHAHLHLVNLLMIKDLNQIHFANKNGITRMCLLILFCLLPFY